MNKKVFFHHLSNFISITIITIIFLFSILINSSCIANTEFSPLNRQIRMNLPREIKHVGNASLYVIENIGYKLVPKKNNYSSVASIINQPVPPEAYEGHIMTIADALLMLIGENNRLLIDSDNKLISFEEIPKPKEQREQQKQNDFEEKIKSESSALELQSTINNNNEEPTS